MVGRPGLLGTIAAAFAASCGHIDIDPGSCPEPEPGCTAFQCNDQCFELCEAASSWIEANAECSLRGGCLAMVDTTQLQLCIGLAIGTRAPWIGLLQEGSATTLDEGWRWTCDPRSPAVPNWGIDQPNDNGITGGIEDHESDCGFINPPNGVMSDESCNLGGEYLCQLPRS